MNIDLLAQAKGWEEFIVPVIVGAIYLIAHIYKGATAEKKAAPKRPQLPKPQPQVKQASSPNDLLDQAMQKSQKPETKRSLPREFDQAFGGATSQKKPRPTPPPIPQRPPAPRNQNRQNNKKGQSRPQPQRPPLPQESRPAEGRHLQSQLERRHAGTVHSDIEKVHLSSLVDQRKQDRETAVDPALSIPKEMGDPLLEAMVQDRNVLRRAYILGIVLGPPLSMQPES